MAGVMPAADFAAFLGWALPRMGLRAAGFANNRGQVGKRIRRRIAALGLADVTAYRARLEADPAEWDVLRGLSVVTISRFYRDAGVWETLRDAVLPEVADAARAAGTETLDCWSLGCASGEEPYTLSIVWQLALAATFPRVRLRIWATDVDDRVLGRARVARYDGGSLRELPVEWRERAFERDGDAFRLREEFRAAVDLRHEDVRAALPERSFRVILCRNVVSTYFDEGLQPGTFARLRTRCSEGGVLVLGRRERLPTGTPWAPWYPELGIYRATST